MRTTLEIEDDVYFHARRIANAERVAIGKVVSRLMRNGLRISRAEPDENGYVYKNGIPVLGTHSNDQRMVSQALIDRIRKQVGI